MGEPQSTDPVFGAGGQGRNSGNQPHQSKSSGIFIPTATHGQNQQQSNQQTLGLPLVSSSFPSTEKGTKSAFRPTHPILSNSSSLDEDSSSPDEVRKRMSAMQDLFAQKQAELLDSYQQAQNHLLAQHFRYLQDLSRSNAPREEQEMESQRQLAVSLGQLRESIDRVHLPSAEQTIIQAVAGQSPSSEVSQSLGNISAMAGVYESLNELHSPINSSDHGSLKRSLSQNNSQTISAHTRKKLIDMLARKGKPREKSGHTGSPHFEPYPPLHINTTPTAVPSHVVPSDFQLRKASSEPNLKMRIRQKLLNRHPERSPPTYPLPPQFRSPTAFAPAKTAPIPMDRSEGPEGLAGGSNNSGPNAKENAVGNPPPAFIFPSPSLPNIPQNSSLGPMAGFPGMDLNSAAAAALLASCGGLPFGPGGFTNPSFFFSMPPVYPFVGGSQAGGQFQQQMGTNFPPLSICMSGQTPTVYTTTGSSDDVTNGSGRSLRPVDMRAVTSPLPLSGRGQPNLLKQQLRDLVLRRKSLVPEETDDEARRDLSVIQAAMLAGNGSRCSLKGTGLAYDSAMSKHQCVCGDNKQHVEHGGRIHSIWARLQERGLVELCERVTARKAHLEMLKLCHSETYVTFFGVSPTACLKMDPTKLPLGSFVALKCGGIGVDSDTYFNDANTQVAARLAVGHVVELALNVAEKRLKNGFAVVRPPGHHAERDQAMAFCYFNNVAIAAKMIQQRCSGTIKKIAIIDWDAHHGNGTQLAFEKDPNVLYLSLHRHDNGNFFPGTGAVTELGVDEGRGFTVNIPWTGGVMGDPEYLAAWRTVITPVLDQFKPDLILVSAGFDAARGHSPALGGYQVSPQLFGYFTRQLGNYAGGKVVLSLEGGYDLEAICDAAEECVGALLGRKEAGRVPEESLSRVPLLAARESLQKVVAVHKKFWVKLSGEGLGVSQTEWEGMHSRFASLSVNQDS